jgi:NADH-quinone oxidoreductase subunit M
MVNHGLVVAPLLFIIALLADRAGGSEDIRDMGGIGLRAPILATTFLIIAMATLAIPGSGNFVGEFMILLGVFNTKIVIAIVAFAGVVMAAVYMLRVFIRSVHNRTGPHVESRELRWVDGLVLAPLVAVILAAALYPQFELHRAEKSVVGSIAAARARAAPAVAAGGGSTAVRSAAPGARPTGFTAYAPVPASPGGPGVETAANEVTVTVR